MTQVPTVFLIALIVIVYSIISHMVNWLLRKLWNYDDDNSLAGIIVGLILIYLVITVGSINLLQNLIVPTP